MPLLSIHYSRNKRANGSSNDMKGEGEAGTRKVCVPLPPHCFQTQIVTLTLHFLKVVQKSGLVYIHT